jgi:hypothetical protein
MKGKPVFWYRRRGNCYAAAEALFHIFGGKARGWKAMRMQIEGQTHWFIQHKSGMIVDPSVRQFKKKPNYSRAVGTGFLTKKPSQKARVMINLLTWQ